MPDSLVEGVDYYIDNGFMVFTAIYLLSAGIVANQGAGIARTGLCAKAGKNGIRTKALWSQPCGV